MASTKKQDKNSTVPEQTAPAPGDQSVSAAPSGSDASSADAAVGGTATIAPGADSGTNSTTGSDSVTELPIGLAPVATLAKGAASADVLHSQSGQADGALDPAADPAGLDKHTSIAPVELNPTQIEVYPLRSFMDEGELRRRGGPSYLVPRLHAEDLEHRKLVSRTPLEK